MKKLVLLSVIGIILFSCSGKDEERYVFEEERVLDVETGDEYYFKNADTMTVVHIDGVSEPVTVTSTPFAESEKLKQMMADYQGNLTKRKEALLEEQKDIIIQQRKERYAEYGDDELLDHFDQLHEADAPFENQMDVIAELVSREVIGETDAPKLLEIDVSEIDFEVELPEEVSQ